MKNQIVNGETSQTEKRGSLKTPASLLPDVETLTVCLTSAFSGYDSCGDAVRILDRKPPQMMSTFPNEVVTCRLADGSKRRLFIKYERGHRHDSFGHRGGVAYEAEVYRRLLQPLSDFRPKCLGAPADPNTGSTWLVLQYVSSAVRVSDLVYKRATRQPRAMAESARWIGKFHATHEPRVGQTPLVFLRRYDAEYYRGWARRTFEFARPLRPLFPWLIKLREAGDEWFVPLLAAPPTIIHGEFYAKTVLIRKQKLFMVDWESAAIAAGEIDLAALTEGKHWPEKIARHCEREYQRSRWPQGGPVEFRRTLDAAKVYLHFRWLGERQDWTVREKTLWRYDHLRAAAERLGLL